MAKWIYTLKAGMEIREAIKNENTGDVIRGIEKAYEELKNNAKQIIEDSEDIESFLDDIEENNSVLEGEAKICDEEDYETLEDFGLEDFDELGNERLSCLYDLCDSWKIWVEL